jgi:cell division protein FtsL
MIEIKDVRIWIIDVLFIVLIAAGMIYLGMQNIELRRQVSALEAEVAVQGSDLELMERIVRPLNRAEMVVPQMNEVY